MRRKAAADPAILICTATRAEALACRRGVASVPGFEVLQTGVGLDRAAAALERRLAVAPKPQLIVSSGFAGALTESVPARSWVTAMRIVRPQEDGLEVVGFSRHKTKLDVLECVLVSSSEIGVAPAGGITNDRYVVADMESAALAERAESHQIPFLVLRLVTDTPLEPLPEFVAPLAAAMAESSLDSRVRFAARAAIAAARRPKDMLYIVKNGMTWSGLLSKGWKTFGQKLTGELGIITFSQ